MGAPGRVLGAAAWRAAWMWCQGRPSGSRIVMMPAARSQGPAGQCDLVVDGAPPATDDAGAGVAEQSGHGHVTGVGQGGETADAFLAGAVGQPGQQLGAQS